MSVSGTDIVFLVCSSADFAIAKMKLRLFDFESENSALKRADRSQLTVFYIESIVSPGFDLVISSVN